MCVYQLKLSAFTYHSILIVSSIDVKIYIYMLLKTGQSSTRDERKGCIFIQALTKTILENAHIEHLRDMIPMVKFYLLYVIRYRKRHLLLACTVWSREAHIHSLITFDERVILHMLPYMHVRLVYNHYANTNAQGSDRACWSQKVYFLIEGN